MGSSFKPATRINNLPVHATPFIGRAQEVVEISHLLLDPACRLLTLSGPGGIGKTRLALQAAMAIAEQFPAGVCFVSLQAVTAPELLATVIAQALNLPPTGHKAPALQLLDYLQDQALLLLLDNFEQLLVPDEALNQAEALLIDLLEAAPRLKLLVTSREILTYRKNGFTRSKV